MLGLDSPDVRLELQSRNVIGVLVALIARPGRARDIRDIRGRRLGSLGARLEQPLLLVDGVGYLGRLPRKVKVPPDGLLRRRVSAKSVVVEDIVCLVELVAEAVVGVFEVDAAFVRQLIPSPGRGGLRPTHRHRGLRICRMRRTGLSPVQSQARSKSGPGPGAGSCQSQRMTWRGGAFVAKGGLPTTQLLLSRCKDLSGRKNVSAGLRSHRYSGDRGVC